jgi:hypothetical protein
MTMKKYKVCRLVDGEVISPFQKHPYGNEAELFGKKLSFEFDDSNKECSNGFYATDADGIIYSLNKYPDCKVYEVEVGGKEKIFDAYKQRFSEATFVRRLTPAAVRKIIKAQSDKMDWNYYEACYPIDPRKINVPLDREKALSLLRAWASVRASFRYSFWTSVGDSVRASVGDSFWYSSWTSVGASVRASVGASVRASVGDSVGDSFGAYISSLFPNIKKWKGINHADGVNPFQSGIDLWMMGLIPSFDGKVWRLHKGEKMDVVLEISKEDLKKEELK